MVTKITFRDDRGRPYQENLPGTEHDTPTPVLKTSTLIGLDLGQRQDFTALAFVERRQLGEEPARYQVRRLRRWREVPYTTIRDELAERMPAWGLTSGDRFVIDETGVGVAVLDIFKAAPLPIPVTPITITAGMEATRAGLGWHVPKRDLVSTVAVLLEQRRIEVAEGLPEAVTLQAELGTFRTKVSAAGHDSYGAWREGEHDDLVLAVALACWRGEHGGGLPVWVV